jgi:hypothetical protein
VPYGHGVDLRWTAIGAKRCQNDGEVLYVFSLHSIVEDGQTKFTSSWQRQIAPGTVYMHAYPFCQTKQRSSTLWGVTGLYVRTGCAQAEVRLSRISQSWSVPLGMGQVACDAWACDAKR